MHLIDDVCHKTTSAFLAKSDRQYLGARSYERSIVTLPRVRRDCVAWQILPYGSHCRRADNRITVAWQLNIQMMIRKQNDNSGWGSPTFGNDLVAGSTVNYFLSIKKGLLYLKNGMVRC